LDHLSSLINESDHYLFFVIDRQSIQSIERKVGIYVCEKTNAFCQHPDGSAFAMRERGILGAVQREIYKMCIIIKIPRRSAARVLVGSSRIGKYSVLQLPAGSDDWFHE
jgi:hypothetical protein